ncbi:MAG: DUF4139 domain-containing protein [Candidatus Omnitrophica bacterium]|nr:DUF4139 domain-containing protein [Candidatus Omnitrophota bacterium]
MEEHMPRLALLPWVFAGLFLAGRPVAAQPAKSGAEDQVAVEVTVYNSNLGLVKDVRQVKLPEGEGQLQFMDVASAIMPETVHVKSLDHPDQLELLEQNYEYDLISPQKLLEKYVGKTIKLSTWNQYQDRKDVVEATLLSMNSGPVYRIGNEIHLGHEGRPIVPELPENLIARPTLSWQFRNQSRAGHRLEAAYLTNNITWKADYVLVLAADDATADLSGWVTLDNKSGAAYKQAKLKLVAGSVHRAIRERERGYDRASKMLMAEAQAPQFQEQGFFEYHLYDLQRPTTVKDNQTKQIQLLEASGATVQKELLVYGEQTYYTRQYREENPKQPVAVYVNVKNSKDNHLGMALPEGIVRTYKADRQGSLQFIGEDSIRHTPKDEMLRLKIGEAFDVVAERRQTDFKQISSRQYETEWEIMLKNHKEEAVTVGVIEPLPIPWTIVQASHPYEKKDAFTIRFDVPVPKDGEAKITYRVRVGI